MHADLVGYWIRTAALLVLPIAPHFSEHIWTSLLSEPESVQRALWPEPTLPNGVDATVIDAAQYMRGTIKMIRDAELLIQKRSAKAKPLPGAAGAAFDANRPKAVRIFVATSFPEWQDVSVGIVKDAYDQKEDKVDDGKIREALTKKGLMKDKRVMPFIQAFKVWQFLS